MSDKTLKKELLKDGIEIKSNKKKGLLKDMYMFFRWERIKIHKEQFNYHLLPHRLAFILAILLFGG